MQSKLFKFGIILVFYSISIYSESPPKSYEDLYRLIQHYKEVANTRKDTILKPKYIEVEHEHEIEFYHSYPDQHNQSTDHAKPSNGEHGQNNVHSHPHYHDNEQGVDDTNVYNHTFYNDSKVPGHPLYNGDGVDDTNVDNHPWGQVTHFDPLRHRYKTTSLSEAKAIYNAMQHKHYCTDRETRIETTTSYVLGPPIYNSLLDSIYKVVMHKVYLDTHRFHTTEKPEYKDNSEPSKHDIEHHYDNIPMNWREEESNVTDSDQSPNRQGLTTGKTRSDHRDRTTEPYPNKPNMDDEYFDNHGHRPTNKKPKANDKYGPKNENPIDESDRRKPLTRSNNNGNKQETITEKYQVVDKQRRTTEEYNPTDKRGTTTTRTHHDETNVETPDSGTSDKKPSNEDGRNKEDTYPDSGGVKNEAEPPVYIIVYDPHDKDHDGTRVKMDKTNPIEQVINQFTMRSLKEIVTLKPQVIFEDPTDTQRRGHQPKEHTPGNESLDGKYPNNHSITGNNLETKSEGNRGPKIHAHNSFNDNSVVLKMNFNVVDGKNKKPNCNDSKSDEQNGDAKARDDQTIRHNHIVKPNPAKPSNEDNISTECPCADNSQRTSSARDRNEEKGSAQFTSKRNQTQDDPSDKKRKLTHPKIDFKTRSLGNDPIVEPTDQKYPVTKNIAKEKSPVTISYGANDPKAQSKTEKSNILNVARLTTVDILPNSTTTYELAPWIAAALYYIQRGMDIPEDLRAFIVMKENESKQTIDTQTPTTVRTSTTTKLTATSHFDPYWITQNSRLTTNNVHTTTSETPRKVFNAPKLPDKDQDAEQPNFNPYWQNRFKGRYETIRTSITTPCSTFTKNTPSTADNVGIHPTVNEDVQRLFNPYWLNPQDRIPGRTRSSPITPLIPWTKVDTSEKIPSDDRDTQTTSNPPASRFTAKTNPTSTITVPDKNDKTNDETTDGVRPSLKNEANIDHKTTTSNNLRRSSTPRINSTPRSGITPDNEDSQDRPKIKKCSGNLKPLVVTIVERSNFIPPSDTRFVHFPENQRKKY
ncbi:hypothetical protein M8J77_004566 [Diaphorina citri]|nr:hypothetical protein M8J77_004566 [Diaphorina citri]